MMPYILLMSNATPTLTDLKVAADDATNAYYRALPGGRRGWKRVSNSARLSRLCAEMRAANETYIVAMRAYHAARRTL